MSKTVNVITAALAGFVVGILTAPKSGKETREDIKTKAVEAKELAAEKAEVVKGKATAGLEAAKSGAHTLQKDAKATSKSVRDSVR